MELVMGQCRSNFMLDERPSIYMSLLKPIVCAADALQVCKEPEELDLIKALLDRTHNGSGRGLT
jgi:hypothetical protein